MNNKYDCHKLSRFNGFISPKHHTNTHHFNENAYESHFAPDTWHCPPLTSSPPCLQKNRRNVRAYHVCVCVCICIRVLVCVYPFFWLGVRTQLTRTTRNALQTTNIHTPKQKMFISASDSRHAHGGSDRRINSGPRTRTVHKFGRTVHRSGGGGGACVFCFSSQMHM